MRQGLHRRLPIKTELTPGDLQLDIFVAGRTKTDEVWISRIAEGAFRGPVEVSFHFWNISVEFGAFEIFYREISPQPFCLERGLLTYLRGILSQPQSRILNP